MLSTEWKILESQNNEIRHEINRCRADLQKYDDKLQVLDNMTHLATQSLEVYFQAVSDVIFQENRSFQFFSLAYGKSTYICY